MAWKINFTEFAAKQFKKLNKSIAKQLMDYLKEKVLTKSHPTGLGSPLLGNKSGLWRYRVNDYRIICQIKEEEVTILIVRLGHRKDIYE